MKAEKAQRRSERPLRGRKRAEKNYAPKTKRMKKSERAPGQPALPQKQTLRNPVHGRSGADSSEKGRSQLDRRQKPRRKRTFEKGDETAEIRLQGGRRNQTRPPQITPFPPHLVH